MGGSRPPRTPSPPSRFADTRTDADRRGRTRTDADAGLNAPAFARPSAYPRSGLTGGGRGGAGAPPGPSEKVCLVVAPSKFTVQIQNRHGHIYILNILRFAHLDGPTLNSTSHRFSSCPMQLVHPFSMICFPGTQIWTANGQARPKSLLPKINLILLTYSQKHPKAVMGKNFLPHV